MTRARIGVVVGLAVAALALTGCGGGDDDASGTTTETETTTTSPQTGGETGVVLKGSVGPGFEISLTTEDGQPVETLAPGSYTLLTDDKSDIHNFHLTGDGVDVSTDVGSTGTDSFDITVTSGSYTFVCDPHSSTMNGSFEVSG
jgi:plastocyanin